MVSGLRSFGDTLVERRGKKVENEILVKLTRFLRSFPGQFQDDSFVGETTILEGL